MVSASSLCDRGYAHQHLCSCAVDDKVTPIWNTMGVLPGHIKNEVVVIGNHRDGTCSVKTSFGLQVTDDSLQHG